MSFFNKKVDEDKGRRFGGGESRDREVQLSIEPVNAPFHAPASAVAAVESTPIALEEPSVLPSEQVRDVEAEERVSVESDESVSEDHLSRDRDRAEPTASTYTCMHASVANTCLLFCRG